MSTFSQNPQPGRLSLIDLASVEFRKADAAVDVETAERAEEARKTFLVVARSNARNRFGVEADELEWRYTPDGVLPEDIEEATAPLGPDRAEFLRYRYNHGVETDSFELVQPCDTCGESRINEVTDLVELGRLLALPGGAR